MILASGSPQRKKLLRELGRPFAVIPSGADERSKDKKPSRLVRRLALRKARWVAASLKPGTRALVLGADTLVFSRGKVIGKPKNARDSMRILNWLNGRWQSVVTGVAVVRSWDRKVVIGHAVSRCKARRLPRKQLRALAGKHADKAGSYAVQDLDDPFIERVVGSIDNVVGLPVDLTRRLLRDASGAGKNLRRGL